MNPSSINLLTSTFSWEISFGLNRCCDCLTGWTPCLTARCWTITCGLSLGSSLYVQVKTSLCSIRNLKFRFARLLTKVHREKLNEGHCLYLNWAVSIHLRWLSANFQLVGCFIALMNFFSTLTWLVNKTILLKSLSFKLYSLFWRVCRVTRIFTSTEPSILTVTINSPFIFRGPDFEFLGFSFIIWKFLYLFSLSLCFLTGCGSLME